MGNRLAPTNARQKKQIHAYANLRRRSSSQQPLSALYSWAAMKLKLQNPFHGSMDPWPLTERLARFLLTAAALLFINAHTSILKTVVRASTGLKDPQALPDKLRQVSSILCGASAFFLFLALGLMFADRSEAIAAILLSIAFNGGARWWLHRKGWGLSGRPRGKSRAGQVLKRIWQVIRHGSP